MTTVFMGTPEFACPPLLALHRSRHQLLAVVTAPDQPAGRGKKLTPSPVSRLAQDLGLPLFKPERLRDERFLDEIRRLDPELIAVVAFRILPRQLYQLPRRGSINVHASLLPRYRGAAPIQWALINGEASTGLSSFYLQQSVDTGDLICRQEFPIDSDDTYDSLYRKLADAAGPFLVATLDAIEAGTVDPIKQDDRLASPAPKITPFDALIDFGLPANRVRDFVRGLSSRPGAFTEFRGEKLKILACRVADGAADPDTRPGTIVRTGRAVVVQCARSAVELTQVVPAGRKPMDGTSFSNGFRPEPGEILGEHITKVLS